MLGFALLEEGERVMVAVVVFLSLLIGQCANNKSNVVQTEAGRSTKGF